MLLVMRRKRPGASLMSLIEGRRWLEYYTPQKNRKYLPPNVRVRIWKK